jgi:hypothetical protein
MTRPETFNFTLCDEGNDIAIGISYLKISSTLGLLGECLRELYGSRLEFLKQTLHV